MTKRTVGPNVRSLEKILKLMDKYQVSFIEWEGTKIVKNKFPLDSVSPTLNAKQPKGTPSESEKRIADERAGMLYGQNMP